MQPPVGTRGYFPGVKRPEHEVDYSPPSSAKIKNEWSCTYTLHTVSWRGQGKLYLLPSTLYQTDRLQCFLYAKKILSFCFFRQFVLVSTFFIPLTLPSFLPISFRRVLLVCSAVSVTLL